MGAWGHSLVPAYQPLPLTPQWETQPRVFSTLSVAAETLEVLGVSCPGQQGQEYLICVFLGVGQCVRVCVCPCVYVHYSANLCVMCVSVFVRM